MIDQHLYFKLLADCILTKGIRRSTITDLTRGEIHTIPNDLFDLLDKFSGYTIEKTYSSYGENNKKILDGYFDFLISNELIYIGSKSVIDQLTSINEGWDYPASISNAIIEFNSDLIDSYSTVFDQLEELFCNHIQIRCYKVTELHKLVQLLEMTNHSRFKSIEIITKYSDSYKPKKLIKYLKMYKKCLFTIHSTPINKFRKEKFKDYNLVYLDNTIDSHNNCGQITREHFVANIYHFFEAQRFNTCLNRKLSIDTNGDIKNCPSLTKSFGNIENTSLFSAIQENGFMDYWEITKDKIETCKDCEFRYVCSDCRAFLQNQNDIYSKPAKCSYNPYLAKWEK